MALSVRPPQFQAKPLAKEARVAECRRVHCHPVEIATPS